MSEQPKTSRIQLVPIAIFLAVAGLFAIALKSGDPSKLPSTFIGKPAPKSEFPAIEGLLAGDKPVPGFATADLAKGRVSLVNFWASWCNECVNEHVLMADLKAKTGVDVYGVDYKDTAAAARRFLSLYGNPYTAVGADANGRQAIEWGVYGMPETFVVDGAGIIVFKHVGAMTAESIATQVVPAIERARATKPAQ